MFFLKPVHKISNILFIVPLLLLVCCNDESYNTQEEISVLEPEVTLEPGTRTSKGGLILSQNVLLDKNMNFAYIRLNEKDDDYDVQSTHTINFDLFTFRLEEIIYEHFKDNFDFIAVMVRNAENWYPHFSPTRCAAQGIACPHNDTYDKRLKGRVFIPNEGGVGGTLYMHEIAHYWGNYGVIPTTNYGHWGYSNVGGFLGGYDTITYLGDKTYQGTFEKNIFTSKTAYRYGNLELYLMGLIPASELKPIIVAENPEPIGRAIDGKFTADTLTTIQPGEFISTWGERLPSFENSQKKFKMLTIIVGRESIVNVEYDEEKSEQLNQYHQEFSDVGSIDTIEDYDKFSFWKVTGGRATIETKISKDDLKIAIQ